MERTKRGENEIKSAENNQMEIVRYTYDKSQEWDDFVERSKNGTFLFMREYMDYHKDRFTDHSLMFYNGNKLVALLPANENKQILYSHQGLTYGGIILSCEVRMPEVLQMFELCISYLRDNKFHAWHYKQVPTCYHRCPSEEDEYALWCNGAQIEKCFISTTIPLNGSTLYPDIERRRKRGLRRAEERGYKIEESTDLSLFWPIMEYNLQNKYNVKPVHTLDEMQLLHSRFPERIKLFLAMENSVAQAGCVAYIANDMCVHIQYGHATPQGKADGALDMLYLTLMEKYRKAGFRYFDFGNSNEQGGHYLNENLISQKEGFGGRGITYKQWMIEL